MPALNEDIEAGIREQVIATWSDTAIKARYVTARDGQAEPAEGFFDAIADAQTAINARGALIGTERRRFAVVVQEILWIAPVVYDGGGVPSVPCVRLVDARQSVDRTCIICRAEVNLQAGTTTLELFG